MTKHQQKHHETTKTEAAQDQQVTAQDTCESQQMRADATQPPIVSLCTVTYNRSAHLSLLQRQILAQTYPRNRMEWVLVDDSDDGKPQFEPDQTQGLTIVHKRLDKRLPLGAKRNLSHTLCRGEIIIYLDDDDIYPSTRVAHAVERLLASEALIAGSTILPIMFLPERELWIAGPYGDRHATAGTFAFKRELLAQSRYDDDKSVAEEKSFLKNYTLPMVQLNPSHTILCIAHDRNTFEKRKLIAQGHNPRFRKADHANTERVLHRLKGLLPHYENLLDHSSVHQVKGLDGQPSTSLSEEAAQAAGAQITRLSTNQPLLTEEVSMASQTATNPVNCDHEVNICVVSHSSDTFSLCFLDVARYLRYRLRLIKSTKKVYLSKNRLYKDAINIILGAHAGFEPGNCQRYKCIFVNLEQLGESGKKVRSDYLDLLKNSAVIDYDPSNLEHYRQDRLDDVSIISFGYAPYLQREGLGPESHKPLQEREIDILFYGSMNNSRRNILQRLARHGGDIKILDCLFGPERDTIIRNAKLVVNISYYEKGIFEQVRAFHCLSLGTPMLSLTSDNTANIPAGFHDAVFFMNPDEACDFIASKFKCDTFYREAQSKLSSFRNSPHENFDAEQQRLCQLLAAVNEKTIDSTSHQDLRINLGSGRKYIPGWINIDIDHRTCPDITVDLSKEIELPLMTHSKYFGTIKIDENSVSTICADNVLEHVSDLVSLMTNCLRILIVGGKMEITVPYERSPTAWQDPTHVRAFNENSWIYYTDWCWYLGWFYHHFKLQSFSYLDAHAKTTPKDGHQAFFMKVVMTKEKAAPKDLNRYRLLGPDFGPGMDDCGDAS